MLTFPQRDMCSELERATAELESLRVNLVRRAGERARVGRNPPGRAAGAQARPGPAGAECRAGPGCVGSVNKSGTRGAAAALARPPRAP